MTYAGKLSAAWITEDSLCEDSAKAGNIALARSCSEIVITLSSRGAGNWNYVNDQMNTRRKGESKGISEFAKLWSQIEDLIDAAKRDVMITLIWPTKSAYWRDPRVKALINQKQLKQLFFLHNIPQK